MVVQCVYGEYAKPEEARGTSYTFEAPAGTSVGDVVTDGGQALTVIALGSTYNGPMRSVRPIASRWQ